MDKCLSPQCCLRHPTLLQARALVCTLQRCGTTNNTRASLAPSPVTSSLKLHCFQYLPPIINTSNFPQVGIRGKIRRASSHLGHRCRASNAGPNGEPDSGSSGVPDALPLAGVDTDWRAFRARLVASSSGKQAEAPAGQGEEGSLWAHSLSGPEPGCLLVAHPLMFTAAQVGPTAA